MMQIVLVGLGAGAASALLFASVASGSPLSVLLFYLAPLPILIAAHRLEPLGGPVRGAGRGARASRPLSAAVLPVRLPDRGRGAGLVARLSRAARAPTDDGSGKSVEWYPAGRLVLWCAAIARRHGDRRHPEFRPRRRAVPLRPAPRLRTGADGPGPRAFGLRARCDQRDRQAPDRSSGHHHAAGGRRARHRHLLGQSLSRRSRREGLRPPETALAGSVGDPLSGRGPSQLRGSAGAVLHARAGRHDRRHRVGGADHGLCDRGLCGAACDHAQCRRPRLHPHRRLSRGSGHRLAGAGADLARPCRCDFRFSQAASARAPRPRTTS